MAAPAAEPIGPNIAPASAPCIAELRTSIATLIPSAMPDSVSDPKASPRFENVSERNWATLNTSLNPLLISSSPSCNFFVFEPASNTFLRPLASLLNPVSD